MIFLQRDQHPKYNDNIEGVHFSFPEFEWKFQFCYLEISIIVGWRSMKITEKES